MEVRNIEGADRLYLSIADCYNATTNVAYHLIEQEKKGAIAATHTVVNILNGGSLPAYFLRKIFEEAGRKLTYRTADIQSYGAGEVQGDLIIGELPELEKDGEGCVFIDDVSDTGDTIEALKQKYPKATFATLTSKPDGEAAADIIGYKLDKPMWIVFPWECGEDSALREATNDGNLIPKVTTSIPKL